MTEKDVLVYSQNGVFLLDVKHNSINKFTPAGEIARWTEKYNCALLDSKKKLWLGTQNGLFLIHHSKNIHHPAKVIRIEGLANHCIRSLVEDKEGNIWVGTSIGISRVGAREPFSILNLGPADGVPPVSMEERAATQLKDGRLVFVQRTLEIITFRPEWFATHSTKFPVHLVSFEVNGQTSPSPLHAEFPHEKNYLTFRFSALNYAAPEHTSYRYRMVGLDDEWLHVNNGRGLATANYKALAPGSYCFEAQAATDGGEWGKPLRIPFTICPPWWLTWWAKTGYALIALALLATWVAFYLKRKKAQMERENEAKVNHLFELREQARHQFAKNVNIDPRKIGINKEEEELADRLMKAIENNMDNTDYTVDQLASDVALSRSNLYRRTQAMLGITPNDFLRNVRLKNAARLLGETDIPVNQVSLQCGFASPRYFAQYFKKMFGVTPSEYRNGGDGTRNLSQDNHCDLSESFIKN